MTEKNRRGMVWDKIELSWTETNVTMPALRNLTASEMCRLQNGLFNHWASGSPPGEKEQIHHAFR